jgi:GntR family transcriptional regulator
MRRIAYDDHGAPVEFGTHVYRASRYGFEQGLLAREPER